MSMRIECIAIICMKQTARQVLGAVNTVFLGYREYDLQRSMWNGLFMKLAQGFKDRGNAGLVIRTKDGRAI